MSGSDRSLIVAAIFGLAVIFFGAGLALGGDWTSKPYEQSQKPYASAERYAAESIKPGFAPYPFAESNRCYSAKNHESADLCAQWRAAVAAEKAADAAVWSVRLSIVGFVVALVGTVLVWLGFKATQRTAEAAIDGVKEAGRAADAAREANAISRELARPWLAINCEFTKCEEFHGSLLLNGKLTVKNVGQSSAKGYQISHLIISPSEGRGSKYAQVLLGKLHSRRGLGQ